MHVSMYVRGLDPVCVCLSCTVDINFKVVVATTDHSATVTWQSGWRGRNPLRSTATGTYVGVTGRDGAWIHGLNPSARCLQVFKGSSLLLHLASPPWSTIPADHSPVGSSKPTLSH